MSEDTKSDKARLARLMDKFDRVLKRHVRRLLDTGESDSNPAYSLNMIACLLILVEREKEIAEFPGAAPKRYNRQTFLKDIDEIGFEADDHLMVEIQDLAQMGYIHIGADEEYRALEPAIKFLSMMEAIFPSMPGLSLIAYTLQAAEEVMTGRKEIMQALRQYDETLLTRGTSISKQRAEALRRHRAEAARKKDNPAARKQREAYLEKLRALRARLAGPTSDPTIVITSGFSSNVTIRELFPKQPDPSEIPPAPEPIFPSDDEAAIPPITQVLEPPPDTTTASAATIPPLSNIVSPLPAETQPHSNSLDSVVPRPESEDKEEETAVDELSEEEAIERKIQAFEEHLAMTCPICKEGKILSKTTEKEKTYYYCSNKNCNLVSWGRPHHMSCPTCNSPFLIEFQQQDGGVGLKCPRATCAFQHRDFDGRLIPAASEAGEVKTVRKVAIRKKDGKKTVRRVVRRKG
ncbi:MAG: hypothetical protein RBT11_11320 [Desulfobacterales bacterium]|jgi:ssDNA-binding Zn-finger/Zn-ribbon topoisomerase 1|nr:hypothetical protein [Desulfobacterales bacterium]